MNSKRHQLLAILILVWLVGLTACSGAQAPAASKARSRAVINAGAIVPAEEIRVAEYLAYYDQHFPEPEAMGETVAMDLRPGNTRMPAEGGLAWLQIGLQTKSAETEIVAPLNLAIVIDRSGSMEASDKMPYLKQSLRVFLESLNPDDIVSIVAYDTEAGLLQPPRRVGDGGWIQAVINSIRPDGSTNLHAGMMLGFEAVEQNFDVRRNNRVILLTDGIANEGVTDPDQIAADALAYNEQGIYLSTIGLGLDFNDALLIQLADQGQGGYTFVDSAEEMDRVFREHVAGLKQRVASDVSVTIIPEAGVRLVSLTGQSDLPPAEGTHVALWPLGTGDSSVVLAQLEAAPPAGQISSRSLARVQLHYFDEIAQRPVAVERTVSVDLAPDMKSYDPTWDLEILRNVTIQGAAEGMQEIDRLFQAGRYEAAWQLAVDLEDRLNNAAQLTGDQQMLKDVALMQRYQQTLAQALWETEDRAPRVAGVDRPDSGQERPYRGRADGTATPTPAVPTVKIR